MGSRLVRFNFTPEENEQIEAIIKVPEETRSVIHGIVKDHKNKVVKDAVVKLFEVIDHHDGCTMKPITHTFTDECGQFLFGPLTAHKHYAIKVWIDNVKVHGPIIINPDDCGTHNDPDCEHDDNHDYHKEHHKEHRKDHKDHHHKEEDHEQDDE